MPHQINMITPRILAAGANKLAEEFGFAYSDAVCAIDGTYTDLLNEHQANRGPASAADIADMMRRAYDITRGWIVNADSLMTDETTRGVSEFSMRHGLSCVLAVLMGKVYKRRSSEATSF